MTGRPDQAPAGLLTEQLSLATQKGIRTLTLVRPADLPPHPPLVLAFHGSNQTGSGLRRSAGLTFDGFASAGAVVAYLDGYRRNWNDARRQSNFPARRDGIDDVAFTTAVVASLQDRFGTDPARVFVVGFSAGGAMVVRLLHEVGELVSGAGIISATQPVPDNFLDVGVGVPPVPVTMVLVHGTRDPIVPYGGGMASLWGFRPRGLGLSASDSAAYFAARNGITVPAPAEEPLARFDERHMSVSRTRYQQQGRPPVVLYTVHGGGHTIPGGRPGPVITGRTARTFSAAAALADHFGLGWTAPMS